jgi:hypothetical protein
MLRLHAHMNDMLNDYDTMQSNILCLQETHMTLSMQNEQFPNSLAYQIAISMG